jgi:hypothetical protein
MKKSHLGWLFVSMSPVLSFVHGCAGELDNPSVFVDASLTGAGGSSGAGGGGATGGAGGSAGAGGSGGMMACPEAVTYLQTTCGVGSCHGPPAQVGVDLSHIGTGQQYIGAEPTGACVGHPLIDPSSAENSLLYLILQAQPPRPSCGQLMPYGSTTPIAQTQRACVLTWIQTVLAGGGGNADSGASGTGG